MSVQGRPLEITVIGGTKLRDTEWLSRQDPYVVLEYAGSRYRTKTDTDGGKNPSFNEKYTLLLIEGLREINMTVWNSNTVSADDFIGSGKILLQKVLTEGYDDCTCPLTSRNGRRSGEVRIIMHYAGAIAGTQNLHAPPTYLPAGNTGYPPVYYPPSGSSPYGSYPPPGNTPYGGYPQPTAYGAQPQYGAQPPYATQAPYGPYPSQPYPPQGYPPAPSAGYPPQQGNPYTPPGYPSQHGYSAPGPGSYRPY